MADARKTKRRRRAAALAAVLALAPALGSCAFVGPQAVEASRRPYNLAIQTTNDEQLLLNLVRLKYRDTPYFLEVSSVATQYRFAPSASANATAVESGPGTVGLAAGVEYEERPTVTYSPLQGNEFVERLLSPISFETILLMHNSGWSIERLMRVTVQQMNGVKNAPSASGPTPAYVPEYETFAKAARLMRELQLRDKLSLGVETEGETRILVMRIAGDAVDDPQTRELMTALRLEPGHTRYPFVPRSAPTGETQISIGTRSLLGVLFYLSQGVEAPAADRERGAVTITRYEDGREFDWDAVTGDLLRISSAPEPPGFAAVAVRYRGHWFYIEDSDLNSKSTFSLLSQLFALQAGKVRAIEPAFTLPLTQ